MDITFSLELPTLDYSFLGTLPLPPVAYTNHLLKVFGNTQHARNQSVVHPSIGAICLPFWILSYWAKLQSAFDGRHIWMATRDWLRARVGEGHPMSHLANDALNSFAHLGWNAPMASPATHLHTLDLASFLSTNMVHGTIIDAMIYQLVDHVRLIPALRGKVFVANLAFSDVLRLDSARWAKYDTDSSFSLLQRLGTSLSNGPLRRVIFPINIEGLHWAVFLIDGPAQNIYYGDSLDWTWPKNDVE